MKILRLLLFTLLLFVFIGIKAQSPIGIFENHNDIGKVLHKGTATFDKGNQTYQMSGAGENIWFKKDELHFLYKKLNGDFLVTTQPSLVGQGGNPHRKSGWMIRTSADTSAAMVCLTVHSDGLTCFQFRKKNNTNIEEIKIPIVNADILQLERRGRSYIISVAKLGNPFWTVEVPDFDFPEELLVGLFVCSHDKNTVEQATFSNTRIFTAIGK
jgi:regulation of enolase protein 1 (concanavalin A-like superfamily)